MTGEACYDAIVAAIVAVTSDESGRRGVLTHYDGPIDETPMIDRIFRVDIVSHERLLERMGLEERWLGVEIAIVYIDSKGAQKRALSEGDDIVITAIQSLYQTAGITQIEEQGCRFERPQPGVILPTHSLRVAYSGV